MSTQIQRRRGTTAEHSTFTGVEGELTVDTTKDTAVVHDGTTVGGHPLQKQYPPLGSAAAPTYTFTGDTNTGIYSPGANQVAVATNGVGRLFVDASGNVKIGSTDNSTVATTYVAIGNPGITPGGIQLWSTTAGNSYIQFGDGTNTTDQYRGYLGYVHSSDSLVLGTSSSERLRIDSSGLVGIGTSSPLRLFHVKRDDTEISSTVLIEQAGTGDAGIEFLLTGTRAWAAGIDNSDLDKFKLSAAAGVSTDTKLTVTTGGNVGIGTSSPTEILHTVSPGGSVPLFEHTTSAALKLTKTITGTESRISFANTADTKAAQMRINWAQDSFGAFETWVPNNAANGQAITIRSSIDNTIFYGSAAGTERLRIDSSGRLLVGTSSNQGGYLLQVKDGDISTTKLTGAAGGNAVQMLRFRVHNTSNTSQSASLAGISAETVSNWGGVLTFHTKPTNHSYDEFVTERMRIDSSGNVGIGTTSPAATLDAVAESTNGFGVRIRGRASDGFGALQFTSNDGSSQTASLGAASNTLVISTGNSERARIDSSGRLLVGTSTSVTSSVSQQSLLQVYSTSSSASSIQIGNYTAGVNAAGLHFDKSRGTTVGTNTVLQSGDNIGSIKFNGADGTNLVRAAGIDCAVDGTPGPNDMPGRLVFSTTADGASSPTERMRITNYGGTLLSTSSASINTTNFGTAVGCNSSAAAVVGLLRTARNGDGTAPVFESYGNAGQFRTLGDGDAENTNNSYAGISDVRLKENIIAAGSQWDDLKALQVRKYNFKAETGYNTHTQIGLIAQEVELISPGLVGESVDEETGESTKSVNYSVLYMKAVKALQEAMERIETLEASNTDLLARVSALESA